MLERYQKNYSSISMQIRMANSPIREVGVGSLNRIYNTGCVDIFVLYIFSRNSRFLNIRENMYTLKNFLP